MTTRFSGDPIMSGVRPQPQQSNTSSFTTERMNPPERRRSVVTRPPRVSFSAGSDLSTSSMQPHVGASPAVSLRAARVVKTIPRRPAVNSSSATTAHNSPRQSHKVFFRPRSKGVWTGTHHGTDSQDFTAADSDDSEYSSSCLSTSTQATTVYDSDVTVGKGSGSKEGKVVRAPTPTAPARRGGLRQTTSRTSTSTETASRYGSGSGVTVETPKRTVHIEVLAAKENQQQDSRHQRQIEHVLMEKIEQLEIEKKTWHDKESTALKELEDAMERSSSLGIAKEEVEKQRDDERQHLDELEQEFVEQGKMLGDLRLEFDKQVWDLEAFEKEKDTWFELKAALEEKCTELERSLQDIKDHREDKQKFLVEQVASLQIIKESLEGRVGGLADEHAAQQTEIGNLLTERDRLREESAQQQTTLKSLAEEKAAVEEEKQKVQARVGELETENGALKGKIEGLDTDIQTLKSQIESLEVEKVEQQTQLATVTTERDELKIENASLKEQASAQDADTTKLREELAPLNEELERLRKESPVAERDGLIAATALLKAQNTDQEAEMVKIRDELNAAKQDVTKLQEAQKALESENEQLRSQPSDPPKDATATDELKQQVANLEEEKKKLEEEAAKVSGLTAEKTNLEAKASELETAKAELEQHASQVPQLRSENASLVSQLSAAQQQVDELGAAQQKSSAEMADLQAFMNRLATPKRAQSESRSTTSTKKKSSTRNTKEELVVVRNPQDRGSIQVIRKCDLGKPRSQSQPSDD